MNRDTGIALMWLNRHRPAVITLIFCTILLVGAWAGGLPDDISLLLEGPTTGINYQLVRGGGRGRGHYRGGAAAPREALWGQVNESCEFGCPFWIVEDADRKSTSDGKNFASRLLEGKLIINENQEAEIEFVDVWTLRSPLNEGGRGMELSELVLWEGRLLSFDDRTGLIFEIIPRENPEHHYEVVARHILVEGDGHSSAKGKKIEWSTVKDGYLWLGSFGKEYTLPSGEIKNHWNEWVAVLNEKGEVERKDWTLVYDKMRSLTNSRTPGYQIHEAVEWSAVHRKWFVAPRRVSDEIYTEVSDNTKGSNKLFCCTENFAHCDVIDIGELMYPQRGYSSLRFVPGTKERVIMTLLSEETNQSTNEGLMKTYIQVFDTSGKLLTPEMIELPVDGKFEGLTFARALEN